MNIIEHIRIAKMIATIGMLLGLMIIGGCFGLRGIITSGGVSIPKKPHWSVGPKADKNQINMQFPEIRVYEAIYIFDNNHYMNRYLIFWPSGQVLSVNLEAPINYNKWNGGCAGYYEIVSKSNIVQVESFVDDSGQMRMIYRREEYTIEGDSIVLISKPKEFRNNNIPRVLRRKNVDIELIPNW